MHGSSPVTRQVCGVSTQTFLLDRPRLRRGKPGGLIDLPYPATPEAIFFAVKKRSP